jgi:hypothetical protein
VLIKVSSKHRDDADEMELNASFDDPGNLGYVLGQLFGAYDEEEFIIQIEVVDEALEASRSKPLH